MSGNSDNLAAATPHVSSEPPARYRVVAKLPIVGKPILPLEPALTDSCQIPIWPRRLQPERIRQGFRPPEHSHVQRLSHLAD